MCGFVGSIYTKLDSNFIDLKDNAKKIHYRGPDDFGYIKKSISKSTYELAFNRLSIIDLSIQGHQPMSDNDNRITVVFNGEVYNFKEIKDELTKDGYSFSSNSDTEVIIYSYKKWGVDCVNRFNGMFAIAIFDDNTEMFYLLRDRIGIKPLYYFLSDTIVSFSSELKPLIGLVSTSDISTESISEYLLYGYNNENRTIFNGIKKVEPGKYIEINYSLTYTNIVSYWDVSDQSSLISIEDRDNHLEYLKNLLIESLRLRLIADVNVGIFLSSGIDSSLLTSILVNDLGVDIDTYTIGFLDKNYDESTQAKKIANYLGVRNTSKIFSEKYLSESFVDVLNLLDEPCADSSIFPTYLVSKVASEKSKVVLSADGADELFAGYTKYIKALKYTERYNIIKNIGRQIPNVLISECYRLSRHNKLAKLKEFSVSHSLIEQYDIITKGLSDYELNQFIDSNEWITNRKYEFYEISNSFLRNMLYYDFKTYLPNDILYKIDRATMFNSIEGRVPFLDHNIVEYAFSLDSGQKLSGNQGKLILRELLHSYLPDDLIRSDKKGFTLPIEKWCNTVLSEKFYDTLRSTTKIDVYFNSKNLIKLIDDYKYGNKKNDFNRLYRIFILKNWVLVNL